MDFLTIHADVVRSRDANTNAIAVHGHHGNADVAVDDDLFTDTSGKY